MKSLFLACLFLFLSWPNLVAAPIQALIIDGQNNHLVWPKSTIMMKQYLEETGLFEVTINRTRFTWRGEKREGKWLPLAGIPGTKDLPKSKPDPSFLPDFENYQVVISNFGNNAADWPEETQRAFEAYIEGGGGFVSVHAADNSFGKWKTYNEIIGVGGWGGRKGHLPGAYVYYTDDGEFVREEAPGKRVGAHGPGHEFPITVREPTHPIMRGLPTTWLSNKDECYADLRGPAENLTILATGKDQTEKGASEKHEPMLMVIHHGEGRTFHTTLGHDSIAFEGVGFITTFLRGTEWAATGQVTLPVPDDFPSAESTSTRSFTLKK
ncbi:MAG: ThuA domain-containing protein [Verrucomicrobiota bacterium]